jgi:myosin X
VLEAMGNGKTVYNNNSSRFGKYMVVNFTTGGVIEGGRIIDYLLEKNRVVRQCPEERSFHIFYNVVAGPIDPRFNIKEGSPESYHFTSQSGVTKSPGMDDKDDWAIILEAFKELKFSAADVDNLTAILAAIIHMGEVKFTQAGGAQVANMDKVKFVAELLELDEQMLAEGFTEKKRLLRGEVITTPLDLGQAGDSRDSFCMKVYQELFTWVIKKINLTLKGAETFHSIGILDIFGFENFEENFLEQFNINYANEKLQQYFNQHIFSLEQVEYAKEGLEWKDIDYVDNAECLDMIEKKMGIISLVDEEARMPRGQDESLKNKMYTGWGKAPFFVKPRVAAKGSIGQFGIVHYAGTVMYECDKTVEKNRDTFRDDLLDVLNSSQNDFLLDLFEDMSGEKEAGKKAKGSSRSKQTLVVQFKTSLASLMKMLGSANPYFVRCIKPNMKKVPGVFEVPIVLNQLRYSGMMETVKIRRAGYPVRREFPDFLFRFRVLAGGLDPAMSEKDKCAAVFAKFEPTGKDWKIGNTKAFMREHVEILLEDARTTELQVTIEKIKALILAVVTKHRMAVTKAAVVKIQAWWKMKFWRKWFLDNKKAALKLQACYRGHIARKEYYDLLELKYLRITREAEVKRQEEEQRLADKFKQEEEARLDAVKRAEGIRRAEKFAELEAAKSAEAAAAAAAALAAAKKKAAEEAAAAEAAKSSKQKANEARKKKEAEDAAAAAAAEKELLQKQIAEAKAIGAKQDLNAEKLASEKEAAAAAAEYKVKMEREAAKKEKEQQEQDAFGEEGFGEDEDEVEEFEEEEDDEEEEEVDEYREGFLGMYTRNALMKNLRKRWCVLHEGTFMWFKGQQNFIKAGDLTKMGGGNSTFGW